MSGKKNMDEFYFDKFLALRMNHDMVMSIDRYVRTSKDRWPDRSSFVRAACSRLIDDLRVGRM